MMDAIVMKLVLTFLSMTILWQVFRLFSAVYRLVRVRPVVKKESLIGYYTGGGGKMIDFR